MKSEVDIAKRSGRLLSEVRAAATLAQARPAANRLGEQFFSGEQVRAIKEVLKNTPRQPKPPTRPSTFAEVEADLAIVAASMPATSCTTATLAGLYRRDTGRALDDDLLAVAERENERPYPERRVLRSGGIDQAIAGMTKTALASCGKEHLTGATR